MLTASSTAPSSEDILYHIKDDIVAVDYDKKVQLLHL
jgi:hypothetical protein